jgi:hypothetical protein
MADLDLSAFLGNISDYADLKGRGKLGRIQRLWERYCGLRLEIAKLNAQVNKIEQEILREEPTFFQPRYSLVGEASFPFRPKLEEIPTPDVAFRNAVIRQAAPLSQKAICKRLDLYGAKLPETITRDFPKVQTWEDAYRDKRCRKRIAKLISDAKAS